jgi:lysozyme
MPFGSAGLTLLKNSEGFRNRLYIDPAGIRTIGYGHRAQPSESFSGGIDEPRASQLLAQDIRVAEQAVLKLIKVAITQGQFDALVDFVYNLGANHLAASTLLRDLNIGRYDAAAEQLLMWDHVGKKEVAGLKARREAEFHLWHNPKLRAEVISWA